MKKKEIDEWYKTCEFIRKELQFYSYNDFKNMCVSYKKLYKSLDHKEKYLLQWYIYANPNVKFSKKEIIWEWLNDVTGNIKLLWLK